MWIFPPYKFSGDSLSFSNWPMLKNNMSFIQIFKIDELSSDFFRIQFFYSSLWENLLETVWTALNMRKTPTRIFLQPISDGWLSPIWRLRGIDIIENIGTGQVSRPNGVTTFPRRFAPLLCRVMSS